jgi:hypothetical protein
MAEVQTRTVGTQTTAVAETSTSTVATQTDLVADAEAAGTALLRALEDNHLCDHFVAEPSAEVTSSKYDVRIVRVGPPVNRPHDIRPRSIGITKFKGCEVLWAADSCDGEAIYFARICHPASGWGDVHRAKSANILASSVLQASGASAKTRVSALEFFGFEYFRSLGSKNQKFKKPSSPAKCFSCSTTIKGQPRYDEVTLARTCERYNCRNRKRKIAEVDENDGEERNVSSPFQRYSPLNIQPRPKEANQHHKHATLFASAIIATGLTFQSVEELFLRAHMKLPIRKKQFYVFQKKFIHFIAGYGMTFIPRISSIVSMF